MNLRTYSFGHNFSPPHFPKPAETMFIIKLLLALLSILPCFQGSLAWKQCPTGSGGGVCPDQDTCCPTGIPGVSSCITNQMQDPNVQGQCCDQSTGCGFGYACAVNSTSGEPYCQLQPGAPSALTYDLPRYKLFPVTNPSMIQQIYGFPMGSFQFAYYSNMGNLITKDSQTLNRHAKVETAVIVIHGADFEADDYLLAIQSSIPQSSNASSILIVAPFFVPPEDKSVSTTDGSRELLLWANKATVPSMRHSYRYGADAINAPISSYATMDAVIKFLSVASTQFLSLKRVVVVGHSAGGQFVHRWALLSQSPVWGYSTSLYSSGNGTSGHLYRALDIRVVVANPKSFCYLNARRLLGGNLTLPFASQVQACPRYNMWEFGLDDGGELICPYRDSALGQLSRSDVANHYIERNVVYLAGQFDTELQSDGCATLDFQGTTRLERSQRYFESLSQMFGRKIHHWLLAEKCPHDHWLMFQSEAGISALFGIGL